MNPFWQTRDEATVRLFCGDSLSVLQGMPSESVHCVVTSPPYWALRDYGVEGQLGSEKTPQEYVERMVTIFREVRRVLRKDGTVWLNLGDSYANSGMGGDPSESKYRKQATNNGSLIKGRRPTEGLKPKDLVGIPWRVALALQKPYIVPSCVKSEVDRAWLAAMFDGEGCIGIRRFDSYSKEKADRYQDGFVAYTTVTNNDVPLLDRCVTLTGFGSVKLKQNAGATDGRGIVSRRDSFGWRLDGNKAVEVVRAIYPYLVAKRKQACIVATLDSLNKIRHGTRPVSKSTQEKKRYLWELIKRCNQREAVDLPSWIDEPKQITEPGWYLRQDIIWEKKSPMPESVTDRCTKSHEYIFLLSKSPNYYYDSKAVEEKSENSSGWSKQRANKVNTWDYGREGLEKARIGGMSGKETYENSSTRNLRSVWTIASKPYPGSHFAVFPPEIPLRCIKAGTSEVGCCPECETGWERVVIRQPILRERPNKLTKRTGEEGTGNFCPNDVSGVEYKTLGWKPGCNCYKVGIIKDYPSKGNDEPDKRYNARVQKWLEAWHKLKPTYDALREENLPCVVLDPFIGSGTTCAVAIDLDRDSVGIDISEKYLRNNAIPRISGRLQRYRSKTHLVPRG